MLGFIPDKFMAVAKGIKIRRLRGRGGVKGAKGGSCSSQCDLLAILNAFNIDNY